MTRGRAPSRWAGTRSKREPGATWKSISTCGGSCCAAAAGETRRNRASNRPRPRSLQGDFQEPGLYAAVMLDLDVRKPDRLPRPSLNQELYFSTLGEPHPGDHARAPLPGAEIVGPPLGRHADPAQITVQLPAELLPVGLAHSPGELTRLRSHHHALKAQVGQDILAVSDPQLEGIAGRYRPPRPGPLAAQEPPPRDQAEQDEARAGEIPRHVQMQRLTGEERPLERLPAGAVGDAEDQ